MEDETLAPNDPAAAADDAEIEKLRSERAHLLDAAVAQLGMLHAAGEELHVSKVSLEAQSRNLQETFSALHAADRRALEAVAARATDLEGDVSRLQHDLVAAETEEAEAVPEVNGLEESVRKLRGYVAGLETKLAEANKAEGALKQKNGQAESKIAELEGKVESLEREVRRVLEEKEGELRKAKLAMAELEEKVRVYEGRETADVKFPWKMATASTGAVVAVAAVACYLHHAKSRST